MRVLGILLLIAGVTLVANATLPILEYEIFVKSNFTQKKEFLSPLGRTKSIIGAKTVDLTRASNWFEGGDLSRTTPSAIRYYTLSIPKLKIERATVEIGGEDLSSSLIHYQGTELPGRRGNPVIFGHSVLPQFFNPKNYLTIFSTLPRIENGDEILVEYDGITYRYQVTEMFEVSPTTIEVLQQNYDRAHLTLITCVPPGTYLRRLVVRADLVPPQI